MSNSQRVQILLAGAIELPPEQRGAYLDAACRGDQALRAEVESLLLSHDGAGRFMEKPTMDALPSAQAASAASVQGSAMTSHASVLQHEGKMIGRYKLLQPIGEGGFGVVYMAEQREPVKRRVALKIIKLGMDTKQVIARFEAERQALAMMDHPNIAKVLDAGSTDTGRPYFVMEYIKGVPIIEYCDTEKLDTRARLGLFTSVCHAIQHAHQKGIIHRDIKPSNVLVTMHDGVPVPKVIDFGIAKATSAELTTRTLFTEHRQMIGTPAYMSPEQAEMSGLDIDTRSDIYSLGVLLYELLTGTTPFESKSLMEAGFAEMMRIIREVEPHKPSTRLSSLGATGTRTAEQRHAGDVKKLGLLLKGDLDWIVMKCLEKDRTRRYATANGLADDIRRHLSDEPVTAGAPGAGYRLRKFAKRNRAQVVAAAVVAGALVLGVIGTSAGMVWAVREKNHAEAERGKATVAAESEAKQRLAAEAATADATQQRDEAKRQTAIAEAVAKFQTDMLSTADPNKMLGDKVTVVQAMAAATRELDNGSLKDQPLVEAQVREAIGTTLQGLARYDEAEPDLRKALAIRRAALPAGHPDIADSLNDLGLLLQAQNKLVEAEPLFREALKIYRALPAAQLAVAGCLNDLALLLMAQNKLSEAEPLFREALDIYRNSLPAGDPAIANGLTNLGGLLQTQHKLSEAEPLFREALEIRRRALPAGHPDIAIGLNDLASLLRDQNKLAEAEPLYREALEIWRKALPAGHPYIATGLSNLANLLEAQNKLSEAEPFLREALEIDREALPAGHPRIATALSNLANLLRAQNKLSEAESLYRKALEINRKALPAGHPDTAHCLSDLAVVLESENKPAEAEQLLREALEIDRKALPAGHADIARCLSNLADLLESENRLTEAEPLYREALEIRRKALSAEHPDIAISLNNLAFLLQAQHKLAEAEPLYREALQIRRHAFPAGHPDIAQSLNNLGSVLQAENKLTEAESLYREAIEIWRALPAGNADIANSLVNLASLLQIQNKLTEAEPLLREALEIRRKYLPAGHPGIVNSLINLAFLLRSQNKLAEAEPLFHEAFEIERASLPAGHPHLLATMGNLADLYARQGKTDQAVALLKEILESSRAALPKDSPELAGQLANASQTLLGLKAWSEAEPPLREALAIREKIQPDDWRTFNTESMLGGALLGQKKLAEAEPLLLDGYAGMKQREGTIPPQAGARIPEAIKRLVQLYEAKGNEPEAAAWRAKLEAAPAKPELTGDKQ